jgi:NAD(P)-dependent dehydrogenase (short-subunit alcohol dehydrogenase family)
LKPVGDRVHYSVSKTAAIGLARAMAELTRGTRVTVNSVLPGPTLTDGAIEAHKVRGGLLGISWEESIATTFDEDEPTSLVRRFTDPKEIATTIVYYCSELSAATNGAKILCEGGIVRHI